MNSTQCLNDVKHKTSHTHLLNLVVSRVYSVHAVTTCCVLWCVRNTPCHNMLGGQLPRRVLRFSKSVVKLTLCCRHIVEMQGSRLDALEAALLNLQQALTRVFAM